MNAAVLELPANITIHGVRALHAQLRAGIGGRQLILDGSRVEEVDTAGMQLLLAAHRSAEAAGTRIEWRPLPPAVMRAAQALALSTELGIGERA
jgi:anti-anti-sigma regulatory factor